MKKLKYIYGPVSSWRLGKSLGVDLIAREKTCSFDCVYCQLGSTEVKTRKRRIFTPTKDVLKEIRSLPKIKLDFITLSGSGEPTLAKNLGQVIKGMKWIRKEPVAVLTDSSTIYRKDVRDGLLFADIVVFKLDAPTQEIFEKINRPAKGIKLSKIIKGIKLFKKKYKGRLALQMMFIKENKPVAKKLAKLARQIDPDEVQINTPLRPCGVKSLSKKEISRIKKYFTGLPAYTVYERKRLKIKPFDIKATLRRRPKL
jgi:wyosine [tRNA(Phe)-imidazoG37] synthetase (radical SAM superfamily)